MNINTIDFWKRNNIAIKSYLKNLSKVFKPMKRIRRKSMNLPELDKLPKLSKDQLRRELFGIPKNNHNPLIITYLIDFILMEPTDESREAFIDCSNRNNKYRYSPESIITQVVLNNFSRETSTLGDRITQLITKVYPNITEQEIFMKFAEQEILKYDWDRLDKEKLSHSHLVLNYLAVIKKPEIYIKFHEYGILDLEEAICWYNEPPRLKNEPWKDKDLLDFIKMDSFKFNNIVSNIGFFKALTIQNNDANGSIDNGLFDKILDWWQNEQQAIPKRQPTLDDL